MIQSQLKTILLDRTITNQELAAMTGINQKALTKIIDGRAKSITFTQLNKIIRALDIELNDLFLISPDLDLDVTLTAMDENAQQFNGTVSFIDHDQQLQFDLPLTGRYHQNGSLFTFTLNDAFDEVLEGDGIATRLDQLLPVETLSPSKRALLQLLEQYPEQQAWFEAGGMQLSSEPTDAELERLSLIHI